MKHWVMDLTKTVPLQKGLAFCLNGLKHLGKAIEISAKNSMDSDQVLHIELWLAARLLQRCQRDAYLHTK